MTVGKLISLLEKYPPDMEVVAGGYEGWYYDVTHLMVGRVRDGEFVDDPAVTKTLIIVAK